MYLLKAAITIDHTQIGGSVDLVNFPILFSGTYAGAGGIPDLRTVGNGGHIQNTIATGGIGGALTVPADLAFYSDAAGTIKLSHEFETYNAATGLITVWIKIPSISHTVDTVIYVFYNDTSTITDQENITDVWSNGYLGVWHLAEDPTGASPAFKDSSGNNNNGVNTNSMTSGQKVTGKIFNGTQFNADNKYIDVGSNSSLNITTGNLTLQAWLKTSATDEYRYAIDKLESPLNGYRLYTRQTSGVASFDIADGTNLAQVNSTTNISDGVFRLVAGVRDISAGKIKMIINGVADATDVSNTLGNITASSSTKFGIQAGGGSSRTWNGVIDEVRISSVARTAGWLLSEYNNQATPSSFYTLGGETSINTTTTKTILGKANIYIISPKTILGKANIYIKTSQNLLGKARITAASLQTILGKSTITASTIKTIFGKGKITAKTLQTLLGKGTVTATSQKTLSGLSKVTSETNKTITGGASIAGVTPPHVPFKKVILTVTQQTISITLRQL